MSDLALFQARRARGSEIGWSGHAIAKEQGINLFAQRMMRQDGLSSLGEASLPIDIIRRRFRLAANSRLRQSKSE